MKLLLMFIPTVILTFGARHTKVSNVTLIISTINHCPEINLSQQLSMYDQGCLMLRIDKNNWIKCGVEHVDGQ